MAASLLQAEPDLHQSGDRPRFTIGGFFPFAYIPYLTPAPPACIPTCHHLSRLSDGYYDGYVVVRPGDVLHRQCDRSVRAVIDVVLTFDGRERCCSRPFAIRMD